ncbi:MAG: hypothetical protein GF347_02155 [Candidatus Moranbacteria bacterium]|nr:hypothetical protein [Candidatus Moranbacteria bacterium]
MFIHLLAGGLVFWLFGMILQVEVARAHLILGGVLGLFPDLISFILSPLLFSKWAHRHRDNLTHSIFLPAIFLIMAFLFETKILILAGLAMLTHPFLDLFGIGWGVKLFYPLTQKTYKLFYKGKFLRVWDPKEVDQKVLKAGDNQWIKNIYFKWNFWGLIEWGSLAVFILLLIFKNFFS